MFDQTSKKIERTSVTCLTKTEHPFFLRHNCLIWAVIAIGSLWILERVKAGFGEILRNMQAEAKEFVSYKKNVYSFNMLVRILGGES